MSQAAKWGDLVLGIDTHHVIVPGVPQPVPLPHLFIGVVYDPVGAAIGALMGGGAVLVNGMPVANTGTEVRGLKHTPTPPGTAFAPSDVPDNRGDMVTGSKTVTMGGSSAGRLGSMVSSCGFPVNLPTSTCLAVASGAPVLVGGPDAMDCSAAVTRGIRTKWFSNAMHSLLKPGKRLSCDNAIELRYQNGRLAEVTDSVGRRLRFRTSGGRLTGVKLRYDDGRWANLVQYEYDAEGRLSAALDPKGEPFRYETKSGILVKETNRSGLSFHFEYDWYDPDGWCVRTWGDGGIHERRITYDEHRRIRILMSHFCAGSRFLLQEPRACRRARARCPPRRASCVHPPAQTQAATWEEMTMHPDVEKTGVGVKRAVGVRP